MTGKARRSDGTLLVTKSESANSVKVTIKTRRPETKTFEAVVFDTDLADRIRAINLAKAG